MPQHTWGYPSARAKCCFTLTNTSHERKSKYIPSFLVTVPAALSLYNSTSILSLAWGDHKMVQEVFGSPGTFELVDSFPLETAVNFEHDDGLVVDGKSQAMVKYRVDFPFPWRAIDGETITVTWGIKQETWEWDGTFYDLVSSSTGPNSEVVSVSPGATFVETGNILITTLGGGDGTKVFPFPAPFAEEVIISGPSGSIKTTPFGGVGQSTQTNGTGGASRFYSENRFASPEDLTLNFSCSGASGSDPVTVEFIKTTVDEDGTVVSEDPDSVELDSSFSVPLVINAPAAPGRIYCHSFVATSAQGFVGYLPIVEADQECPDFQT